MQTLSQNDEGARRDRELLASAKGAPLEPGAAGADADLPMPIAVAPESPKASTEAAQQFAREAAAEIARAAEKDLERCGRAAGRPACDETDSGFWPGGVARAENRRQGLGAAARQDPAEANVRPSTKRFDPKCQFWEKQKPPEANVRPDKELVDPQF